MQILSASKPLRPLSSRLATISARGLRPLSLGPAVPRESIKTLGPYDSPEEESMAMSLLNGTASALSYVGTSIFDAIAGRRVRAGIKLIQSGGKDGAVSELFTVPVLSDLFGWTDPQNTTTGKEIISWDDDKRYLDDAAGIAVEVLTDPLTYFTGGVTGIFGTTSKAGKIIQRAGLVDDMAKAASIRLGRKIGRREFMARTALSEIRIPTTGVTAVDRSIVGRLDNAARHYGFDDFAQSQASTIGNQKLSTAWGVTPIPMSSSPRYSFGTGEAFSKTQAAMDRLGDAAYRSPLTTHWRKLFTKNVNETATPQAQARMEEAAREAAYEKADRAKRIYQGYIRLHAIGLDSQEFIDDLWAISERRFYESASKRKSPGYRQMEYAPEDRDVSEIVQELMKHPRYSKVRSPEALEAMVDFAKEKTLDNIQNLADARAVGIAPEAYLGYSEEYGSRAGLYLDPQSGKKIPRLVTEDMMRELKSPRINMTDSQIEAAANRDIAKYGDVRTLHNLVYKDLIEKAAAESSARIKKTGLPGSPADRMATEHSTQLKRKDLFRNIRGSEKYKGGQSTLNMLSMDSYVSGPMAGFWGQNQNGEWVWIRNSREDRHRKIFSEYMNGDLGRVKEFIDRRDAGDLKVGSQYGGLMPGYRQATDTIQDEIALRSLMEELHVEEHAYLKAYDIAKELEDINPRHVTEQIPYNANDPISVQLQTGSGVRDVISQARAIHRTYGDSVQPGHGNSISVLDALERAGLGLSKVGRSLQSGHRGRESEVIANFLRINAHEGRGSWKVFGQDMATDDMIQYLGENPHQRFTKNKQPNPDWLDHENYRDRILTQFGLKESNLSAKGGEESVRPLIDSLRAEAVAKNGGAPLSNRQLREIYKQAQRQGIGGVERSAETGLARMSRHNQQVFERLGLTPYSIPDDVIADATKAMSLHSTPDVIRGAASVWDKITNTLRSHFTAAWVPFLSRNVQTLGFMDYLTNAENPLDPRELVSMWRRWKGAYDFHAGRSPKNIHKLPMFKDFKFGTIQNPQWTQTASNLIPQRIPMPDQMKDRVAADFLRAEFAASNVVSPIGTGELLQDRSGLAARPIAIGDTLPGVGAGVRGFESLRDRMRHAVTRMKEDGIDWKHLASLANPLNLRGGFGKSAKSSRSGYAPVRMLEDANDFSEAIGRTATWLGQLEKGIDPLEAAIRSNAAHVDYNSLSTFERQYMRRIIPFYTYQRKMIPHVLRTVLRHPGGAMSNMVRTVNIANGERRESKFTPQQLAGQLAIPLYDRGSVRAYIRPDLPINVLNNLFTVGPDAYTTFQNTGLGWLSQMHMIPKAFLETAFGRSTFQKGRNLEDMYSRIGIKDPITNQIIMMSPLGRYATQFGPGGVMFDERKSVGERAFQFLTGTPIAHIDMDKATEEALDQSLNKALSLEEGVGRSDRYYVYDEAELSQRAKDLMRLKVTRSTRKMAEAKQRNKERKAELNAPPDRLRRLGL